MSRMTNAGKATALGLAMVGAGILTLYLTGVPGFPTIPPGPIIAFVAAAAVVLIRWRWAPALGLAAALFFLVGAVISPGSLSGIMDRLADPASVGPFAGTAVEIVGIAIGVMAGLLATVEQLRPAVRI